jgi:hypothetical protein
VKHALVPLKKLARELAWFVLLALCVWFIPRTALAVETVCGAVTIALFCFERSLF